MTMTILNIYMKDQDKEQLQKYVDDQNLKSMSEVVRKFIEEKLRMAKEPPIIDPKQVEIPDFIPKNKYIVFVNNAIIAIADTPSEATLIAAKKGAQPPFIIKYNGNEKNTNSQHYIFLSISEPKGWRYTSFENSSYPLIPVGIEMENKIQSIISCIDTGATLCVLKEGIFPEKKFKKIKEETVFTAGGMIKTDIFRSKLKILELLFEIDFIIAPISDTLPFQFLLGRNVLDQLDCFLFGKKQLVWLKTAE